MNTFELRLNAGPFESIKAGTKTIEMRLLDKKRQQYTVGDILIFKSFPPSEQEQNKNNSTVTTITEKLFFNIMPSISYCIVDYIAIIVRSSV